MAELIPGDLYRVNPMHSYWLDEGQSDFRGRGKTFLCTKPVFCGYGADVKERDFAMFNIDHGGLWDSTPSKRPNAYINVTKEMQNAGS